MAASEGLTFSVASVVEDVLQQHGSRHRGLDLESRRAEEAASRRNEAASWLRKMVGVVSARDLPAEPSEEEFRLGLRSGLILCNALNKAQPGAITKVVESPNDPAVLPDGAALSAFQYFENVRNFLVAAADAGLPTFEASDLEQGGISARVVNSVLALKSYYEWKQNGGNGVWKCSGNAKYTTTVKQFVKKNLDPFTSPLSRTSSLDEKFSNATSDDGDRNRMPTSRSLSTLVHALLSDKKPEEVPQLVESVLSKVVQEFEHRIATQNGLGNQQRMAAVKDTSASQGRKPFSKISFDKRKVDDGGHSFNMKPEECHLNNHSSTEQSKQLILKQQIIFDRQGKDLQDLKKTLNTTKAGMQYMQMKFHEELQKLGMHVHGLASAASGYHRVLEENRKLYNEVQDLKGSIRVYCRVRPFLNGQSSYLSSVDSIEEGCITIKVPSKYGKGHKSFSFNKVFGPSATQADVFSDMRPLIRSVLDGFNVCIFAYGQTGSGKTHTMSGLRDLTEQSQGVNYRSLSDLFDLAEQRKDTFQYDVSVQMIEIYNEQVRDLLSSDAVQKRLDIRNSSQNGVIVPDACLVRVSSTYHVINLMNLGQRNRAVGATSLNDRSSRSHSCLTVHVQGKDLTTGTVLRGCMHLVDLAGSERVDKSEVTGDRLKEAQHINKSLSALGDVIASLAQKNSHVPYRNSKLTQLLQDSLVAGGQAKTLMFIHISPEPDATGETISTLKFAERVATVELGAARVNKDSNTDVKELKEQISILKAALARKEAEPTYASPEVYRMKTASPSPYRLDQSQQTLVDSRNRQRVGELGTREVGTNSTTRRRRAQSFDLDEVSSSPWPPVNSPGHSYGEDDREMTSSGDWVDKVMVNRQEATARAQNPLASNLPDSFYQEFYIDSSKLYSQQPFNAFSGFTQLENPADELDELDAATSDSSEPDLLWQFNHSKLPSLPNGVGSKKKKPEPRTTKITDISKSMIPTLPSRKQLSAGSQMQRSGRQQQLSAEAKRKNGSRK